MSGIRFETLSAGRVSQLYATYLCRGCSVTATSPQLNAAHIAST